MTPTYPRTSEDVATFCRVCEPMCGLIARVEDGRLVSVRGDKDSVSSRGHFCKKATAAVDVMYDQDRVTHPLKRVGGPGEFVRVSWDEAMRDIAARLSAIRERHGAAAFATFLGQPPTNGAATAMWYAAFKQVLGTKWNYSVNGEDGAALLKASEILYGSAGLIPRPDLWRSDFAMIIGANPMVSHGSVCTEPLMRHALQDIVKRGGRVVVVDPRRSETAQLFEHVAVDAGTDAWFMLGIFSEIVARGACDTAFLAAHTHGIEELAGILRDFPAEVAARHCGVPAETIVDIAQGLSSAGAATIYGRTGTCTQDFGTLNNLLQSLIVLVTGNLDRPGGVLFPWTPLGANMFPPTRDGGKRSRAAGLPEVAGMLPSRALVSDIATPGAEQVRALMLLGGNPVHSSGAAGQGFADALEQLDLHFALDLYVNETNKHAHYILPVATMFERADVPYKYLGFMLRPTLFATRALVRPRGEVREEWQIMNDLCRRLGLGGAYASPWLRRLARLGIALKPFTLIDRLVRMSEVGDRYGLRRRGVSLRKLIRCFPHGIVVRDHAPSGNLANMLATPDGKIDLAPPALREEIARLRAKAPSPDYPFRLIGLREMLSMNTWLHNVQTSTPKGRSHQLHIHPSDAERLGVNEGEAVTVISAAGRVRVPVKLSDRLKPGNAALPHGWGHAGGWQRANDLPGANSNLLASKDDAQIEPLAGMSILNGIAVRIVADAAADARN